MSSGSWGRGMKHSRMAVVTGKQSRYELQQCVAVICCLNKTFILLVVCEGKESHVQCFETYTDK